MNRKKTNVELLKKGCELYLLSLRIEELRRHLNSMQDLESLSSPKTVEFSELLSGYILRFMVLENEFKTEKAVVHS